MNKATSAMLAALDGLKATFLLGWPDYVWWAQTTSTSAVSPALPA
jgi:hypothetical protein